MTSLHEGRPLKTRAGSSHSAWSTLPVDSPPKLAVVSSTRRKNSSWTIVRGPTTTVEAICLGDGDMEVEDSPLLLDYGSISGGRCDVVKGQHLCNQVEAVLVAHRALVPGESEKCTINEDVTPTNIFGQDTDDKGPAKQLMSCFTYPPGAPNGGPKCVLPPLVVQLLVNRHRSHGSMPDRSLTVVGVRSSTSLAELRGRMLGSLWTKLSCVPSTRHAVGTEVFVGSNRLPAKLVEDITAWTIREAVNEGGNAVELMRRVASDLGYTVKQTKLFDDGHELFVISSLGRPKYPDIPLWGSLIVLNSPEDALAALTHDEDPCSGSEREELTPWTRPPLDLQHQVRDHYTYETNYTVLPSKSRHVP